MTTRAQWLAIAELFEAAKVPDRNLDHIILTALGYEGGYTGDGGEDEWQRHSDRSYSHGVTASLDGITALIKRETPRLVIVMCKTADERIQVREAWFNDPNDEDIDSLEIDPPLGGWPALLPPIALCSLFARAMAERNQG